MDAKKLVEFAEGVEQLAIAMAPEPIASEMKAARDAIKTLESTSIGQAALDLWFLRRLAKQRG